jgi:hypothetical protein
MDTKRSYQIQELFSTEENYLVKLNVILDSFRTPLLESIGTESPILSKEDVGILFSCISEVRIFFLCSISDLIQ